MNFSLLLRGSAWATVLAANAFTAANAQVPNQAENAVSWPPKVEDSIASTRTRDAQKIKFITSRKALGADDTVDWSLLGAPFTALPPKVSATSPKGFGLTIDIAAITATPPIVLPTGPEPSIATAFARGDFILFTGGENPQFPGLENPSPITITFAKPVFGAGANLQPDDECTTNDMSLYRNHSSL
jgi:hypothetical protein